MPERLGPSQDEFQPASQQSDSSVPETSEKAAIEPSDIGSEYTFRYTAEDIEGELMGANRLAELTGYSRIRLLQLMRYGRLRGVFDESIGARGKWFSSVEEVKRYRTEKRYVEPDNPEMQWRRAHGHSKPIKKQEELEDYKRAFTPEDIEGELKTIIELSELTGYCSKHLTDLCRDGSIRATYTLENKRWKWRTSVLEVERYQNEHPTNHKRKIGSKYRRGGNSQPGQ